MRIFVWVLSLALVVTLSVPGAPVSTETKAKPATPAEKIRLALDKTIDFDIENQPFHLALNQLKEQTGVPFILDRFTLQQMGMDPEQVQVNFKAKGVKMRAGLRSMVGQFNLSFAIVGENVVITTDEMAMYRQMRQRVNIDYEGVEYAAAIKQLARDTATNLIIDARVTKEAKGPITLQLEDVPLETAVRLMSEMVGLKPVRVGNVMFICSKTAAADLRTDPDLVPPQPRPGDPGMPPGVIVPGMGIVPGFGQLGAIGIAPPGIALPMVVPAPPVVREEKEAPKPEPNPEEKPR